MNLLFYIFGYRNKNEAINVLFLFFMTKLFTAILRSNHDFFAEFSTIKLVPPPRCTDIMSYCILLSVPTQTPAAMPQLPHVMQGILDTNNLIQVTNFACLLQNSKDESLQFDVKTVNPCEDGNFETQITIEVAEHLLHCVAFNFYFVI